MVEFFPPLLMQLTLASSSGYNDSMLGRSLIIAGSIILALGLIITFAPGIPLLGRLPGDLYLKKEGVTFYFPLATSIILSIILSLVLYLINRR